MLSRMCVSGCVNCLMTEASQGTAPFGICDDAGKYIWMLPSVGSKVAPLIGVPTKDSKSNKRSRAVS